MAHRIGPTPQISQPTGNSVEDIRALGRGLFIDSTDLRARLRQMLPKDGAERMEGPLPLVFFATASLPSAAAWEGALVYDTTVNTFKFSDGTNWLILPVNSVDTTNIINNAVTFAKMQDISTDRLLGRDTAGTGDPEEIQATNGLEFTGSQQIGIVNNGVTNARLADMAQSTIKGRAAGAGTGDPTDLTAAQARAILGGFETIASGSVGTGTTLDINNIPPIYSYLLLNADGISHNSGTSQGPNVLFSTDNGSSFNTTSYRNQAIATFNSTTFTAHGTGNALEEIAAFGSSQEWSFSLYLYGYHDGIGSYPHYMWSMDRIGSTHLLGRGAFTGGSGIDALRITWDTGGSFDGGSYSLQGVF